MWEGTISMIWATCAVCQLISFRDLVMELHVREVFFPVGRSMRIMMQETKRSWNTCALFLVGGNMCKCECCNIAAHLLYCPSSWACSSCCTRGTIWVVRTGWLSTWRFLGSSPSPGVQPSRTIAPTDDDSSVWDAVGTIQLQHLRQLLYVKPVTFCQVHGKNYYCWATRWRLINV